jgi:4-hydroxybenzoyl-CoA thioesterase
VAFEDFFDQQGFPYRQVLDVDHVGWPAVKVECDFKAPLKFGDEVDVDVDLTRVGKKSATFRYRALRGGQEVAVASVTVACVDMRTFASQEIPPAYRELFERHAVPAV